jgi:hypothetical protein
MMTLLLILSFLALVVLTLLFEALFYTEEQQF